MGWVRQIVSFITWVLAEKRIYITWTQVTWIQSISVVQNDTQLELFVLLSKGKEAFFLMELISMASKQQKKWSAVLVTKN